MRLTQGQPIRKASRAKPFELVNVVVSVHWVQVNMALLLLSID